MPALWIAFTLSGAAALLAEQVFEKLLSTLVGASTPSGAVVLAIHFTGLTTGALVYPKMRRATWSPLVVYAALEVTVATACAALAWTYGALVPACAPLLRLGVGRPELLTLLRGVVAAAWILPLTIPMGATFPAIVDATDRIAPTMSGPAARARALSVLYAVNLVGAILAAFAGPLVVFPRTGMTGGLVVACVFDGIAASLALIVARSHRETKNEVSVGAEPAGTNGPSARVPLRLTALAVFTGFLLFALEVTWTHLAGAVLGNSVYAFASMLGSVLIGLGLGSILSAVLFPGEARVPSWAPGAALLAGAIVLTTIHSAWPSSSHALAAIGWNAKSFLAAEGARFAIAAGLLVPPATIFGLAYPLLFRSADFPETERGRAAGRLAGANAVGCIAGALVTGFVVLPQLGSENTERALIVVAAIAGGTLLLRDAKAKVRRIGAASATTTIALVLFLPRWDRRALTLGEHVYFGAQWDKSAITLLSFHEDTRGGITTVIRNAGTVPPTTVLLTNGKFQGNDGAELLAQTAFALVPMQFVSHFDRALVVGLGTGRSAYSVQSMSFSDVVVAEIAPGIVDAARESFPHVNGGVLDAPNVSLLLEDGRNALLLRDDTYDLVTMELSSVWFAGVTNLYSREFYTLVRDRLRPHGVMQQWIQLHHIGVPELESVFATAREVFPFVSFFYIGGQGLVVATMEPQTFTAEFTEHVRATEAWRRMGARDLDAALATLAASRFLAPADIDRIAALPDVVRNTDGNRFLEYATPRYNFRKDDLVTANLAALKRRD